MGVKQGAPSQQLDPRILLDSSLKKPQVLSRISDENGNRDRECPSNPRRKECGWVAF